MQTLHAFSSVDDERTQVCKWTNKQADTDTSVSLVCPLCLSGAREERCIVEIKRERDKNPG